MPSTAGERHRIRAPLPTHSRRGGTGRLNPNSLKEDRMRAHLITLGILLLAACSGGDDDGPTGTGGSSEVTLVGGQVVCDSCESVRIVLAGSGIAGVRSATLITSDVARTTLPARITIDRESGDSGDRLVLTVYFDQGVPEGQFDLWLDPPSAGDAARVVPAALRVTRARPGPGTVGTLRVYVAVSGVDRDFGYTLRTVAGCAPDACAPLAVEAFTGASRALLPGTYTFRLEDVGDNCTVTGSPNPTTLELQRGVSVALSYRLSCVEVANPGWVRVSNVTAGPEVDQDPDYQVSCNGLDCRAFPLAANRDTVLRLPPGQVTIGLTGVAAHCSLASPASVALTVTAGDTVTAAFPVTCSERPAITATIRTSGREIVENVTITTCADDYYSSNFGCQRRSAASNGVVVFAGIDPGVYTVYLDTYSLPENCAPSGGDSRTVQVLGSAVSVAFEIICRGFGTVRVTTVTTGTNQDASYEVVRPSGCDDYYYVLCDRKLIAASGSVDYRTASGTQWFQLTDVASNCAPTTANPATVTVVEDAIVDLRFEVICR
jgi:hypothetical protein